MKGDVFIDPFAGSGSVSRLAKALGFSVYANDWEFYAWVINYCHIAIEKTEARGLFSDKGGLTGALALLSEASPAETPYIGKYYAPASTKTADYREERLFYTAENALFIDSVREQIERWYPGWDLEPDSLKEKCILTASLLYESATHANTSGVFKACHKGFGGHGRDALKRIMSPMELEIPVHIDGGAPCGMYRSDAGEFVRNRPARVCYLDPPYNIHQYGSNYFMLNTIAKWDKPTVNMEKGPDGRLSEKAAIRKDWTDTRSPYCYKHSAPAAFKTLLDAIDAEYILTSYNTEGIIPFEEVAELLSSRGGLSVESSGYTTYRGGRQSAGRKTHNTELLFIVRRTETINRPGASKEPLRRIMLLTQLNSLGRESYNPDRIKSEFQTSGGRVTLLERIDPPVIAAMSMFHRFLSYPGAETFENLSVDELTSLRERLAGCRCADRLEESEALIAILGQPGTDRREFQALLQKSIRKIAHKKYRTAFYDLVRRIYEAESRGLPGFAGIGRDIEAIEALAELRFKG